MITRECYKCIDVVPFRDRQRLGSVGQYGFDIWAVATNEKRPPKAGEWFLSGNPVEAYRTRNDLSMVYRIARLVRVVTTRPTVRTIAQE